MHHHDPHFQREMTHRTRVLRYRIGRNIHTARLAREVTLDKLARLSGLSAALIDRLELGKGEIGLQHIVTLAGALRMDVALLLAAENRKDHLD